MRFKSLAEFFFRSVEIQISYKNILHACLTMVVCLSVCGFGEGVQRAGFQNRSCEQSNEEVSIAGYLLVGASAEAGFSNLGPRNLGPQNPGALELETDSPEVTVVFLPAVGAAQVVPVGPVGALFPTTAIL